MGLHDRNLNAAASEPTTDTSPLMHAGHVVREFLVHLKAHPITDTTLVDIGELPMAKTSLINAFRLLIASETRMQQRGQLQRIGLLIAQFQPLGAPAGEEEEAQPDPLETWIDDIGDVKASNEQNWLSAYREHQELTELFEMSARMAEQGEVSTQVLSLEEPTASLRPH